MFPHTVALKGQTTVGTVITVHSRASFNRFKKRFYIKINSQKANKRPVLYVYIYIFIMKVTSFIEKGVMKLYINR